MAKVIEHRDVLKGHRIKVKAENGNITYASTEGYKNIKDCRNAAINTAIQILDYYASQDLLNVQQKANVNGLVYRLIEEEV